MIQGSSEGMQVALWVLTGVATVIAGLAIYIFKRKEKKEDELQASINEIRALLPVIKLSIEDIKLSVDKISTDLDAHKKEYYTTKERVSVLLEFKKYAELRFNNLENNE